MRCFCTAVGEAEVQPMTSVKSRAANGVRLDKMKWRIGSGGYCVVERGW